MTDESSYRRGFQPCAAHSAKSKAKATAGVEYHQLIIAGARAVQDDVQNQIIYV